MPESPPESSVEPANDVLSEQSNAPSSDPENSDPTKPGSHFSVTREQLPLSCPMPTMALWNQHPRVYLAIEKTGSASCPYCGTQYTLTEAN